MVASRCRVALVEHEVDDFEDRSQPCAQLLFARDFERHLLFGERPLGSANSISLGRLLPQVAYYAHAALHFHAHHGTLLNFIVPTGNLGNACAAFVARRMGLPVGELVLACNANDVLPRYFAGAAYAPQPAKATLANAMDVGAPSNFERLRHWHDSDAHLRTSLSAHTVDDDTIRDAIRSAPSRHGIVPCPHTATGLHVLERLRAEGDQRSCISSKSAGRRGRPPWSAETPVADSCTKSSSSIPWTPETCRTARRAPSLRGARTP